MTIFISNIGVCTLLLDAYAFSISDSGKSISKSKTMVQLQIVMYAVDKGQVIYYDEDFCGKPFFVREKGFFGMVAVIAGYNDKGAVPILVLEGIWKVEWKQQRKEN